MLVFRINFKKSKIYQTSSLTNNPSEDSDRDVCQSGSSLISPEEVNVHLSQQQVTSTQEIVQENGSASGENKSLAAVPV